MHKAKQNINNFINKINLTIKYKKYEGLLSFFIKFVVNRPIFANWKKELKIEINYRPKYFLKTTTVFCKCIYFDNFVYFWNVSIHLWLAKR